MNYRLIDLKVNGDERGKLIAFEKNINCPFEIKRAFYIFDTKMNIARGQHANRFSEFMLVLISGSCKIKINDGMKEEIVTLDNPRTGLYLNKMIWKEMYDFSHNAILLILTSTNYDPNEYINNFDEFLCEVRGK